MRHYILAIMTFIMAFLAKAAEKTDVIPGSLTLTASYTQQVLDAESGATWLVTLKNDGNGPQCKAGGSGIATKASPGRVKSVSVEWGSKSNENIIVYGSHSPYTASNTTLTGTTIGTINFVAGTTQTLNISDDWEYIAMTSTSNVGKACQFITLSVTWIVDGEEVVDAQQGIVINEVCGNDGTSQTGSEDWIEISNSTESVLPLTGASLVFINHEGVETNLYTYPAGSTIAPGAHIICRRNTNFTTGIPHTKNFILKLVSASGNLLDKFDKRAELSNNGHHNQGGSYSRIPDITGDWTAVENATAGATNDPTPIRIIARNFTRVKSVSELKNNMEVILVNEEHAMAMSTSWDTTKDGGVYQLAEPIAFVGDGIVEADANRVVVCTLRTASVGKWGLYFGDTNNYYNEDQFLACPSFKSFKFKDYVTDSGVATAISINAGGDAELDYGTLGGSIKFNYKGDGTDRFLNYDPIDKPEEHLPVFIYRPYNADIDGPLGSVDIIEADPSEENPDAPAYNTMGQRVSDSFRGIVIKGGKKIFRK